MTQSTNAQCTHREKERRLYLLSRWGEEQVKPHRAHKYISIKCGCWKKRKRERVSGAISCRKIVLRNDGTSLPCVHTHKNKYIMTCVIRTSTERESQRERS